MAINPATTPHFPVGSTVTYSFAAYNYASRIQFHYKIGPLTLNFDFAQAIRHAFNAWSSIANIKFQETADSPLVDIRFGFQNIDGPGRVLGGAWGFISGNIINKVDIALDVLESWTLSTFQSVALHEIGHALGLPHEDGVPSVMSTYARAFPVELTSEDMKNIRALYPSGSASAPDPSIDPARCLTITADGVRKQVAMDPYSGPVAGLVNSHLGADRGEAMQGSDRADFINAAGGPDAIDGGGASDVLDGGTGSNFLTGGEGTDTFFVDGRGGGITWSTVTDLDKGEWVTAWGWSEGVSKLTWAEMSGAPGYLGATAHIDLDGNGSIDMSATLSGRYSGSITVTTGQVNGSSYLAFALS